MSTNFHTHVDTHLRWCSFPKQLIALAAHPPRQPAMSTVSNDDIPATHDTIIALIDGLRQSIRAMNPKIAERVALIHRWCDATETLCRLVPAVNAAVIGDAIDMNIVTRSMGMTQGLRRRANAAMQVYLDTRAKCFVIFDDFESRLEAEKCAPVYVEGDLFVRIKKSELTALHEHGVTMGRIASELKSIAELMKMT